MKLTASPFDPRTGDLLPVYRDAYLRGDLSRQSATAVDAYLRKHENHAEATLQRWYELNTAGNETLAAAPTWVARQLTYIRQSPQRFRQRAAALVLGATLVAGAASASTLFSGGADAPALAVANAATDGEVPAFETSLTTRTLRGRIVDEHGRPLVGATVLLKGGYRGASTNADGYYQLQVPATAQATELKFGYAGYEDAQLSVQGAAPQAVTLAPRPDYKPAKKHRWFFF